MSSESVTFERSRVDELLESLEQMAGGELGQQIAISPAKDELDAVAHAVNVMAGELNHRLTELKLAQSTIIQAGKLAALGEVSSGLAHELNNPLAIIRGYLEHALLTIKRNDDGGDTWRDIERYLRKMDEGIDRMSAIIQHVREFSRQSSPRKVPLSLDEPIRSAFILVGEQLRLRKIEVKVEFCSEDARTMGDAMRLEQVFLNLLANARDAIWEAHHEEGGTIKVRLRALSERQLEVEIADDGIGMTEDVQQRMFDPFFTTKEVGRGTGLGLSISLGIIQEHQGEIVCESKYGEGTRIRIVLPRLTEAAR